MYRYRSYIKSLLENSNRVFLHGGSRWSSFSGPILHKAYPNRVEKVWHRDMHYHRHPLSRFIPQTPQRNAGKKFLLAWENYALATELTKKAEGVQVATLLTVIGEEAREVYATLNDWENDGDEKKIKPVLKKFGEYCEPRKNVPFERFKFNRRVQESY